MPLKLLSSGGGSVILDATSTASNFTLTAPAVTANLISSADSNTVSTTMLADSGITATKMGYTGAIIATTIVRTNTRSSVTAVAGSTTLFSGSFTKLRASSQLIATCTVFGCGSYSGVCGTAMNIDGTNWDYGSAYQYDNQWQPQQITPITGTARWSGISAGSHTVGFGWNAIDGSTNRPFNVFNPNSSDDSRSGQMVSSIFLYEVV